MEFKKYFLEILRKLKDFILCGKKRQRSEDEMREDENLFFSIKKRRLSEPKFSSKKRLFNPNSLIAREKNLFSPINNKEIIRNIFKQADLIFADRNLSKKMKNLKIQILNQNENISNLSEREYKENNINQEYTPEIEDRHLTINENDNFMKFTFKKIQYIDMISQASKNESPENINEMPANRIENQLSGRISNEDDNNICNLSDNKNLPTFIELLNSKIENDNEESVDNEKFSKNSRNDYNINLKPKFSFLNILEEKEELKVPVSKQIDTNSEDYDEIIKNISIKSDSNNFPIFSSEQYKNLNEFFSGITELNLPAFLNVSPESLKKLKPGNWLNDEVVNSYINLIQKRQNDDKIGRKYRYAKVFIFNSYFYQKLKNLQSNDEYSYEKMRKFWTNKNYHVNLFDYDYVMIPINSNNSHWSLVTVNLSKKKFSYYDSFEDNGQGFIIMNSLTKLFTEYVSKVKDYKDEDCGLVYAKKRNSICEEEATNRLSTTVNSSTYFNKNFYIKSNIHSDEYESESESDIDMMASFWKFKIANTPKQQNGADCGVFMCKFMDYLARDELINFTQKDLDYFRFLMGIEIIEGEILTI